MVTKAKPSTNGTGATAVSPGMIHIPRPEIVTIGVEIIGMSSLIVNAWSEKAKRLMMDAQQGGKKAKLKQPREARDPEADHLASRYVADDGWDGVPSVAFKAACVGACRMVEGLSMVMARRLLFILPEGRSTRQNSMDLVRIHGEPRMREDMVRLKDGSADFRFRAEYLDWRCLLKVQFNRTMLADEQVLSLLELAGQCEGICEWRPSSPESATGHHGQFRVATAKEAKLSK